MDFLEGKRAHAAAVSALGDEWIVMDHGARLGQCIIEFDVLRRGQNLGEAQTYRVRLAPDGTLRGSFPAAHFQMGEDAR
jgi:hypothetical protein